MGAWGAGPFENDGAADLLYGIADGSFTFDSIAGEFENDYLEVDGGQIALALAELVAAGQQGREVQAEGVDAVAFVAQLAPERIDWIRQQALRAISGPDTSELYDLWDESGELESWLGPSRAVIAAIS